MVFFELILLLAIKKEKQKIIGGRGREGVTECFTVFFSFFEQQEANPTFQILLQDIWPNVIWPRHLAK